MTLKEYLKDKNSKSAFTVRQSDVGGNITFSNSGKRGTVKEFTLGLDSFVSIIKDIKSNIDSFRAHKEYDEKDWRDLGSKFYSDGPANAMSTVQTKPLFSTISKIISWANLPNLENIDTDQYMEIEEGPLDNAIDGLTKLAERFLIKEEFKNLKSQQENIIYKENSIRDFAKYIFTFFYGDDWYEIINFTKKNSSDINGVDFISHDFEIFKRLIGEFPSLQNKESLTSSNTIRYFEKPVFIENNKFFYFTTQWNGEGDYSLSFSNLKLFFENKFPEFRINRKDGFYYLIKVENLSNIKFAVERFISELNFSGLAYSNELIKRFIASLLTKPFVILTGLSGSGKTKLAQAFVQWICQDKNQYRIIPVGADWTNREPLLGYPNALKPEEYVKPDSGVLDLIIQACNHPELPHFLILDEMNLSHVERYFADFLSVMESKEEIPLHAGKVINGVPENLKVPSNLFIIGTVNIDETTNMFSPKVLDRANTIEFRVTMDEMNNFLGNIRDIDIDAITGKGSGMAKSFLELAASKEFAPADINAINSTLVQFFGELKKTGAEFGYRSATEILRLINQLTILDNSLETSQKVDIAVMQKLLPKLHGSRRKLCPVLETLGSLCITGDVNIIKEVFEKVDFDYNAPNVRYPLSLEKIARMYRGAIDNGFTSFAEA